MLLNKLFKFNQLNFGIFLSQILKYLPTMYNLQTFILYSGSISCPNVIELSHVAF